MVRHGELKAAGDSVSFDKDLGGNSAGHSTHSKSLIMQIRSFLAAALATAILAATPAHAENSFFDLFKRNDSAQLNQKPAKELRSGKKVTDKKQKGKNVATTKPKKQKKVAAINAKQKAAASVASKYAPQTVAFTGYKPGTIVINTKTRDLYYVESMFSARKYKVAVGKEGLLFTGKATVGDMQEWPRWIPTKDMIAREPKKYGKYKDGMDGGPENPLGARAIYLYQGKNDTHIRIHGTTAPNTIGTASSNGCFRMINEHVIELYQKVKMGTPVVVL